MSAAPPEEVWVVHHEGCGDEPGPAPVPLQANEDDDESIDAVAFTTKEAAEAARDSAWPDGTVEPYLLVKKEPSLRDRGREVIRHIEALSADKTEEALVVLKGIADVMIFKSQLRSKA